MPNCYDGSPDPAEYAREVCGALERTDFELLRRIGDEIIKTKATGAMIYTAGNGGSAATASHMINDLMKGCRINERTGFRANCLNDPNAVITCLANDFSYEDIYAIELKTLARRGDLLIVFSGSGNSENILRACDMAKKKGMTVIGFGGRDGGRMKALCDLCMIAPTYNMEQLEDLHMFYVHALVSYIRDRLKTVWDTEIFRFPGETELRHAVFGARPDAARGFDEWEKALRELGITVQLADGKPLSAALGGMSQQSVRGTAAFCFSAEEVGEAAAAGAYAIGVAGDERKRDAEVDEDKRAAFIALGACCIIPDFSAPGRLREFLFGR